MKLSQLTLSYGFAVRLMLATMPYLSSALDAVQEAVTGLGAEHQDAGVAAERSATMKWQASFRVGENQFSVTFADRGVFSLESPTRTTNCPGSMVHLWVVSSQ